METIHYGFNNQFDCGFRKRYKLMREDYDIDFETFLVKFKEKVSKLGFKNSIQKDYILKVLFFTQEHLCAEQITAMVKKEYNIDVGIATVYRTMSFFEELNIVESLDVGDGVKRYELSLALHHDHLVCTSCSKIIEFTDELIEKQQEKVALKNNFKLKNHVMTIYGLCENCQ